MLKRTRVRVEFIDDQEPLEFITTSYMCAGDRVAWERHFGKGSGALANMRSMFDEESGELKEGVDTSPLHEEWTLYFTWRTANRSLAGDQGAFDPWVERVQSVDLESLEESDQAGEPAVEADGTRPTDEAALPV